MVSGHTKFITFILCLRPAATILTHLKHMFITCCVWNVCLTHAELPPYPIPQPSSLSNSHKGMSNSYSNCGRLIWPSQSSLISKVSWVRPSHWLLNDYCQLLIYNLILFFHVLGYFGRSGYQLVAQMCWCRACLVSLCVSYRLLINLKCECISQPWQGWDQNILRADPRARW